MESVQKIDYEKLFKEIFPGFENIKPKVVGYEYHCGLCMCPIEYWKPYRDYPLDRSCELFYFLDALLAEEKGSEFTVDGFVEQHGHKVKEEFLDLTNVAGVFKEHVDQQLDIGDIEEVSPGVFVYVF